MTPEQIKEIAKQAGGTPYVNRNFPGKLAVAFHGKALIEFVRMVREAAFKEAVNDLRLIEKRKRAELIPDASWEDSWEGGIVEGLSQSVKQIRSLK